MILHARLGRFTTDNGMLRPLEQAGFISVHFDQEEGLACFVWKPRIEGTNIVEGSGEEWYIAPGEATFVPVPQCTERRAFALKFNNTKERQFFWLQEHDQESYGDGFVNAINAILDGKMQSSILSHWKPHAPSEGARVVIEDRPPSEAAASSQGSPRRSARVASSAPRSAPVFQSTSTPRKAKRTRRTRFSELLNPDALASVLADDTMCDRLCAHLPPGRPHTAAELAATIRSPQFQQTLSFMDEMISAGDMAALAPELGIDAYVLSANSDASDLYEALRSKASQKP